MFPIRAHNQTRSAVQPFGTVDVVEEGFHESQFAAFDLALEHAPGYVAQRCIVVAALLAGSHPRDAAALLAYLRKARAERGYKGSTVELQVEAFAEQGIRDGIGDGFDEAYAEGLEFDETRAVGVVRRGLLEMASASQGDE